MIPYGRQSICAEDIEAVVEVLRSDFLTQGPAVPAFEKAVCERVGADFAVAVNSATSALHLACLALGLGEGDTLWTSPLTFVASANCALYCNARVDFVDVDSQTANMSAEALERKLAEAKIAGALPKIVVAVHLCGQPCDMEKIHGLSQQYGFHIIEDASHAIGATYQGLPVGDCRYSDITVFSFHPVKIITTGEGGMAVTNRKDLADRMLLLRSHGITRDADKMTHAPDGPWYYQQIALGYNYRMTDIQAALGSSQMHRLDGFLLRRRELAARYDQYLASLPLKPLKQISDALSSWHLYVVLLDNADSHSAVFNFLRGHEIGVNLHYIPVHLQPYYQTMGFFAGGFPQAEAYYRCAISLPLYPDMSDADQQAVVNVLREALDDCHAN